MSDEPSTTPDPRAEKFGFVCGRCSNCCHNKIIQLNPYEVARLAANRGMGTAAFRERWTEDGAGTFLRRTESGACVFLGAEGCTVHADRPLVCRLYPLGRQVTADGTESFRRVTPHPDSKGAFTAKGDIADYLRSQGTEPFMVAADGYLRWFARARGALSESGEGEADSQGAGEALLDMDMAIEAHCARTGEPAPTRIEERRLLHMRVLALYLEEFEGDI